MICVPLLVSRLKLQFESVERALSQYRHPNLRTFVIPNDQLLSIHILHTKPQAFAVMPLKTPSKI